MAQARGNASTRAIDSLSDSNPSVLGDNQRIVQNEDGAVLLYTTVKRGEHEVEFVRRCDSEGDLDHQSKGGKLWWSKLLRQQKLRDEAKAKPVRKSKGDA